ncbi:bifunctional aldolase/short-chain dehydrogenase [Lysinibacillus telephonicus]|uniref:Bifunctional aldolase/short-chain dehydrogenase n=2 Tax=Lysinibacillus telephonicus TaxID=1714840 RepID=A0A431UXB8_9BACI|nr:bifunctional aldolase/short-chain dehydrogenase [Lysinibacillus telephonicus]
MMKNVWNVLESKKLTTDLEMLAYRSNLIGSDRTVCNWGGGNTSVKSKEINFKGDEIDVLWVKGSGSDLATIKPENFTGLNLQDILPLFEYDDMSDEEMVAYLEKCMIDSKHPRASIETLLHAFLPFPHIDHTHPDAIISLCCAHNGKKIAEEIFGDRFVWVPYLRPGFKLSKLIAESVKENPGAELVLMEKHGLVTWGYTAEECYNKTIEVIEQAEAYITSKIEEDYVFGGQKYISLDDSIRTQFLSQILPIIRGSVSDDKKMLLKADSADDILQFVNSVRAKELSSIGAACPDHLVHTKRVPLYVEWDPSTQSLEDLKEILPNLISQYKLEYREYFERNKNNGDVMFEPAPRVILIPGIGMISTGKTLAMADISGSLYHRAIAVMKGSTSLGDFVSLNENESYNIEYWPLELYKLSLAPKEAEFSRQVAFITGGAGGIGSATAKKFVADGAHVVVADINLEGAQKVADELNQKANAFVAAAVKMDVTKEEEVSKAIEHAILTFGGIDIIVNNAGLATSSPFEETTLQEWELNMNVLGTGYFLVAREAFKLMQAQGLGGNMVFVGSKNSIYAGKNAAAYSSVKALEVHLARCIASEGGQYGIRVNSVLPDAVLQGSAIWGSRWREERAAAYNIHPDQLEEHYRKRTTLLVNIFPEDIADAILFFASSKSSKTTGSMITVDGGVPAAFTR